MSWDGAYQETRSVTVRRGAEDRTIAAWEAEGWELDARPPGGRWSSEIFFRRIVHAEADSGSGRPRGRSRILVVVGIAAAAVLAAIVVGTGGDDPTTPPAAAQTSTPSEPATAPASDVDAAFAALSAVPDPCDGAVADVAATYAGHVVELDATVEATAEAARGYDVLLRVGETGPDLGFQGVTVPDLHLVADGPDYIAEGDSLHLTAEVGDYRAASCVLLLVPVTTEVR